MQKLLYDIDEKREVICDFRTAWPDRAMDLDFHCKLKALQLSDALEGSQLSYSDICDLHEEGTVSEGQRLRDYLRAAGHKEAYEFMEIVSGSSRLALTDEILLGLHFLMCYHLDNRQAGNYKLGVDLSMESYLHSVNENIGKLHPILLAVYAHQGLMSILPFPLENEAVARLVLNMILTHHGLCPVGIPLPRQDEYHGLVKDMELDETFDRNGQFAKLIGECELEMQNEYCKMGNISIYKE